ncbi:MAG: acyl-CoA dehydrogenase family protein [Pseudomonadales bacterium]|mgnify:FL=1|jgi:alkylation response protein AidB-like acyl-CoA dehydrogenase|nr:acyl-CoA dehydrogenase family protein [Pseudomonadales bacterium]MDP6471910.1 acyl-CoA dehydrogenase family protein [Pseudomonadales bacterium]MDP6826820.1 acyl-CoA dehydrogenase family protein [Pseudomonadales bacterium]MDP6970902.1 acyl-CoA dehydrogenase family protein [Pseudomonadales bacterium]|tara:strand:- start:1251 stop:2441 length:1191 start_codon:yes stop_codon:yes gene_type:complete
MSEAAELRAFREETRAWLEENCPPGAKGEGQVPTGSSKIKITDPDVTLWLERMAEKGWTVPTWPAEYGGAALSTGEYVVFVEEMRAMGARAPLMGMGTGLIGPTLLEHGTEDQKARHLPPIARGEVHWCQGYSEPSAGSDLASLRTRAEDNGDHFVINGQKIWTSGAQFADWMFALVRTDPDVPKHEGISFVLLTMDQPGVTVKTIRLISGNSPFCETFFDNAIARKEDLVGELNKGWTVGKRLLQHERSGMSQLVGSRPQDPGPSLEDIARRALGEANGRIGDPDWRQRVLEHNMNSLAYRLTQRRTVQESQDGTTPGPATSIFKMYGTELQQDKARLMCDLRGTAGFGWSGDAFDEDALKWTRSWLSTRAASIYSGSNEIQRNIIAKRVLGLPD